MSGIVAISGMELNRHETLEIDLEVIKMSEKKRPKVLYIPTLHDKNLKASADDFKNYFGKHLGCRANVLELTSKFMNAKPETISDEIEIILHSNIVYIGGDDAQVFFKLWRKLNMGNFLRIAFNRGIIMCGLNVGGIYWFKLGDSDPKHIHKASAKLFRISDRKFLEQALTLHFNKTRDKIPPIKKIIERTSGAAIALKEISAIAFIGGKFKVLSSSPAYKICWNKGKLHHKEIENTSKWRSIHRLFKNDDYKNKSN